MGPGSGRAVFGIFPAIFVASATLIEEHERERRQKRGLAGRRRGTDAAALDAAGAALGTLGLVAFGSVVWWLASDFGGIALLVASIAWLLVAVVSWYLRRYVRCTRGISK
jgi:apolipoprotein N-acyltransferase